MLTLDRYVIENGFLRCRNEGLVKLRVASATVMIRSIEHPLDEGEALAASDSHTVPIRKRRWSWIWAKWRRTVRYGNVLEWRFALVFYAGSIWKRLSFALRKSREGNIDRLTRWPRLFPASACTWMNQVENGLAKYDTYTHLSIYGIYGHGAQRAGLFYDIHCMI